MTDLQYPIGMFACPPVISAAQRAAWIEALAALPDILEAACVGLDEAALKTPYRDGGWTIRQVVHHVADSHMNSCIRFKLALTEDGPTIRPYFEDRWATLPDTLDGPLPLALSLIRALHVRWVFLLQALDDDAWSRTYLHPSDGAHYRLDHALGLYAWHGRHHVAHITTLRDRMGWS